MDFWTDWNSGLSWDKEARNLKIPCSICTALRNMSGFICNRLFSVGHARRLRLHDWMEIGLPIWGWRYVFIYLSVKWGGEIFRILRVWCRSVKQERCMQSRVMPSSSPSAPPPCLIQCSGLRKTSDHLCPL
jgi:hypothetical protein